MKQMEEVEFAAPEQTRRVDMFHGLRVNNALTSKFSTIFWPVAAFLFAYYATPLLIATPQTLHAPPVDAKQILTRCDTLNVIPGPSKEFYSRKQSDRFVPGTQPTLIKNATIWTGNDAGKEVLHGDVLLDKGLIKWLGVDAYASGVMDKYEVDLTTIDAKGAWLTPGIIDVHAHSGVERAPASAGSSDGNSLKGPIQPWLRALDGLAAFDASFELAVAGGVTTNLILPGSANAIGGQGFVIKLRPTAQRTPTSMLLEPPQSLNGSNHGSSLNWRHMKHACGENPSRVYSQTRMDTFWQFREGYNKARKIKVAQDDYCEKAYVGQWKDLGKFPEDLQWEALVDVLRGKVKVQTHCYEAVDLDDFVRLSNEFEFEVAAFHHAVETYLVPDVLKRAYGSRPPASAIFAAFSRYKREAWRHSEFAARILNDNGLRVVMKSDHSAIVNRYLPHEAQQAHYYGLPAHVALSSITSTPADVLGLDHRIGYVREGYDADIVLWDSHPLALGATPLQVIIDGIVQLKSPFHVPKPSLYQKVPKTPDFDEEAKDTIKYEGLPPLRPSRIIGKDGSLSNTVIFTNVSEVWVRSRINSDEMSFQQTLDAASISDSPGHVVVMDGRIVCQGSMEIQSCSHFKSANSVEVDLEGGSIAPGLVSSGTALGLGDIAMEESTTDGVVMDALFGNRMPTIIGGEDALIRAVDGLQFENRDQLLAYRGAVTSAITAPVGSGFISGLSVAYSTGARSKLDRGAIIKDITAVHVSISHAGTPSISTQIATLRSLLFDTAGGSMRYWVQKIRQGKIPLVVHVHSANTIATLIMLKQEVEIETGITMKMTLTGATEAHILAKEIAEAGIGVIVSPVRPFPFVNDAREIMPGIPLSKTSAIVELIEHGVVVGMGVQGLMGEQAMSNWSVRNMRFDIGWEAITSNGKIGKYEALALGTWNIEKLLGISADIAMQSDMVALKGGGLFDFESKVIGILSSRREQVELL